MICRSMKNTVSNAIFYFFPSICNEIKFIPRNQMKNRLFQRPYSPILNNKYTIREYTTILLTTHNMRIAYFDFLLLFIFYTFKMASCHCFQLFLLRHRLFYYYSFDDRASGLLFYTLLVFSYHFLVLSYMGKYLFIG